MSVISHKALGTFAKLFKLLIAFSVPEVLGKEKRAHRNDQWAEEKNWTASEMEHRFVCQKLPERNEF